jgi:hypothetical protein
MQQRRLRLGDIVDDYCPRERRITNHAVVAMIEDAVKQTRCTTCDADHEYKEAKVPAQRRKKDAPAAGSPEALAAVPRKRVPADVPPPEGAVAEPQVMPEDVAVDVPAAEVIAASATAPESFDTPDVTDEPAPERDLDDDGPVHRRLIRATLPRPEGHVPERKEPEFTAHQRAETNGNRHGRGRRAPRPDQGRGGQHGSGMGPARFGTGSSRNGQGQRHGSGFGPRGSGQGQRPNTNRPGQRGGQGQPGQHRPNRPGGGGRKRGR